MTLVVNAAMSSDLQSVFKLLKMVDLPIEGVREHLSNFLIAYEVRSPEMPLIPIGCVGLEIYGHSALLRSLAVHPAHQRKSIGTQLVAAITKKAQNLGINRLYLLTDTAVNFFQKFSFSLIDRDKVPDDMKESIEFTSLCVSSPCLMKDI